MKQFIPLPSCDDVSKLTDAIEHLIDVVQDYVQTGYEIDIDVIFDVAYQGLTLDLYNQLVKKLNGELALQSLNTESSKTFH